MSTEQAQEPKQENKALSVKVSQTGDIHAETLDALLLKARVLMETGFAPKSYKTPKELVGALLHVRQLGLPDAAISKVYIVHGHPAAFGELPLAIAKRAPDFGEMEEFFVDKEGKKIHLQQGMEIWGSVCRIKRKGMETWNEYFFTRDMAAKANLIKNTWNSYFEDLLRYKARSRALKGNYPDALMGLEQAEDLLSDWDNKTFEKDATKLEELKQVGQNDDTKQEESH